MAAPDRTPDWVDEDPEQLAVTEEIREGAELSRQVHEREREEAEELRQDPGTIPPCLERSSEVGPRQPGRIAEELRHVGEELRAAAEDARASAEDARQAAEELRRSSEVALKAAYDQLAILQESRETLARFWEEPRNPGRPADRSHEPRRIRQPPSHRARSHRLPHEQRRCRCRARHRGAALGPGGVAGSRRGAPEPERRAGRRALPGRSRAPALSRAL